MSVLADLLNDSPRGAATKLALALGIHRSSITRWAERDTLDELRLDQLKIIATFFNIRISRLLGEPNPLTSIEARCIAALSRMPDAQAEALVDYMERTVGAERRTEVIRLRVNDKRRW